MKKLYKKVLAIIIVLFAFCSILHSEVVYGWAGGNSGSVRSCTTGLCYGPAGATWAYYKYTSGYGGGTLSLPIHYYNGSYREVAKVHVNISEICKSYGGFYLMGYLQYSSDGLTGLLGAATNINEMNANGRDYRNSTYIQQNFSPYYEYSGYYKGGNYLYSMSNQATIVKYGESLSSVREKFEAMPDNAKNGYSWGNVSAFCYSEEYEKVTLRGVAITANGGELGGNKNPNSVSVRRGSSASIAAKEIDGYHFLGWREKQKSGTPSGKSTYTVNKMTADKTVYAVYEKNSTYEGYSKVTYNGEEASTSWTSQDKKVFLEIHCADDNGTCRVSFEHGFRRISGDKIGEYSIFDTNNVQIFSGKFDNEDSKGKDEDIEVGSVDKCEKNEFSVLYNGSYNFATTSACVSAPYSFETNVKVNLDDMVYAGETSTANVLAWVSQPKGADYMTIARDVNVVLTMTVNGKKYEKSFGEKTFKKLQSEKYNNGYKTDFNVPDIEAGSEICITATITPGSSADLKSSNSATSCTKVAKKPSFQVWGGSAYSAGNIVARTANKNNLNGIEDAEYNISGGGTYFFGSWTELSLMTGGDNKGLASGAALAKTLGGSFSNLCDYSPLTIANQDCNKLGNSGINTGMSRKESLIEKFKDRTETISGGVISEEITPGWSGVKVLTTMEDTMKVDKNIKLNNEEVASISDASMLIIYAKNISISCGVDQVDAILIADNTIDTCYDGGDINSRDRSRQLKINGTVIANYLKLGRTYGAGIGEDSGVPAEIINASTGTYLWGTSDGIDIGKSDQLYMAYMRELSPRY